MHSGILIVPLKSLSAVSSRMAEVALFLQFYAKNLDQFTAAEEAHAPALALSMLSMPQMPPTIACIGVSGGMWGLRSAMTR